MPDGMKPGGKDEHRWNFEIIKAETISWPDKSWTARLTEAETADGFTLMELHRDFGKFTGHEVNAFLGRINDGKTTEFIPDIIASHGHTIFTDLAKELPSRLAMELLLQRSPALRLFLISGGWMLLLADRGRPWYRLAMNCFSAIMIIASTWAVLQIFLST
jgi:hypothetical protein